MPFIPEILIGNTNTYQVVNFRDAVTGVLQLGAEMFLSLCYTPATDGQGNNLQTVQGATNATPIQITSANHGLNTNDIITIVNVGGNSAAKGTFTVTKVDANNFTLNGSVGSAPFTTGGQWYKCLPSANALTLTDGGDGSYTVEIDGELGLIPGQNYMLIFYCLGTYRDIFNDVLRIVARVRGST